MTKQQVIFISGGNPKENYNDYYDYIDQIKFNPKKEKVINYNKTLGKYLGDEYEYTRLEMPDKKFADYKAWKIYFEKVIPYLQEDCIIATTSLGSTFILKYLQENIIPVGIKKLFLLAAAIKDSDIEVLGSFNYDNRDYTNILKQCGNVYIYHSQDDQTVPFTHFQDIIQYFPNAFLRKFSNKGHFYLEERLVELEEDIKS